MGEQINTLLWRFDKAGFYKIAVKLVDEIYLSSSYDTIQLWVVDTFWVNGLQGADTIISVSADYKLKESLAGLQIRTWICGQDTMRTAPFIWHTPKTPIQTECKIVYDENGRLKASKQKVNVIRFSVDSLWLTPSPQIFYRVPLNWKPGYYQKSYEIYLSENGGSFNKIATQTDDSVLIQNLDLDQKYRVYIRSISNLDSIKNSDTISFTTSQPYGMKYLTGGSYQMGSNTGDPDEAPIRSVQVNSYWIDSTEYTFKHAHLDYPGVRKFFSYLDTNESGKPFASVNWAEAVRFANAKSKAHFLDTAYVFTLNTDGKLSNFSVRNSVKAFRLPTDAEWEYAARAGTRTEWFWGNDEALGNQYAVWNQTRPVVSGSKKPNPWGLYDMSGNLWEWTETTYDSVLVNSSDSYNAKFANYRVIRGGSFAEKLPEFIRSANRQFEPELEQHNYLGFRLIFR